MGHLQLLFFYGIQFPPAILSEGNIFNCFLQVISKSDYLKSKRKLTLHYEWDINKSTLNMVQCLKFVHPLTKKSHLKQNITDDFFTYILSSIPLDSHVTKLVVYLGVLQWDQQPNWFLTASLWHWKVHQYLFNHTNETILSQRRKAS